MRSATGSLKVWIRERIKGESVFGGFPLFFIKEAIGFRLDIEDEYEDDDEYEKQRNLVYLPNRPCYGYLRVGL